MSPTAPAGHRRTRSSAAAALAACAVLGATAAPAAATVTRLAPAADATVRSDAPRASDGRGTSMTVQRRARAVRRAYLRFRTRLPEGESVVRARLTLHARTAGGGAGVTVRAAGADRWSDRRLSWRAAPSPAGPAVRRAGYRSGRAIALDVTRLVRSADGAVTLALTTTGTRRLAFSTREAAAGRRPRLTVYSSAGRRLDQSGRPAAPGRPADTSPPAVPSGLTAAGADRTAILSWSPPAEADVAGHRVYRRAADGSWPAAPVATVPSASFEQGGLVNGASYAYRVTAVDRAGNESAPSPAATATPSGPPPGALHSTATQPWVREDGTPLKLLAMNMIPVWSTPGATWSAARYQQIRAKGFDAVRFTLYWDDFERSRGVFDQTSLATLDTAIARAKAAGLGVVLDEIHLWGAGGFQDVPAWARTGDSVTTVATNGGPYLELLAARYRDEPAVIGYDLVNEFSRYPIDQDGVLRAYDRLIAGVRGVDPHKIVVIEPTVGDTSIGGDLADFSNLAHRHNVVFSLHDYYAGGDDDGYAADGSQQGTFVWDGRTGYASPDPAALERHLRVTVDKLASVGIPLWIGEFGIGNGVAGHDQFIRDKVALYERYGLGRSWWEYYTSNAFSAVDPDYAWRPWVDLLLG